MLSLRDVEDLLAERGITVSHETVRRWVAHFGPMYACRLRAGRASPTGRWRLDEVFVSITGQQMYLWRAVDHESEVLDILVQARRDKAAALRLMHKLLRRSQSAQIRASRHRSLSHLRDAALRELDLSHVHIRGKRLNSRAEGSYVPIRRCERKMQGFRSARSAQRFLSSHASAYNTSNVCRHLTTAGTYRTLREQAHAAWRIAASVGRAAQLSAAVSLASST
jgi:putative transposase